MSGERKIDEEATARARGLHGQGVVRLLKAFGVTHKILRLITASGMQAERDRPVRTKLGCPPPRTAEYRRRRKARKTAHESRRSNNSR